MKRLLGICIAIVISAPIVLGIWWHRSSGGDQTDEPFTRNVEAGVVKAVSEALPGSVDFVTSIQDDATYHECAYMGPEIMVDSSVITDGDVVPTDLEYVKFTYDKAGSADEAFYFINTQKHRTHLEFCRAIGLAVGRRDSSELRLNGVLVYRPGANAQSGTSGLFTLEFTPVMRFGHREIKLAYDKLIQAMPGLQGRLCYFPRDHGVTAYREELQQFKDSNIPVVTEGELLNQSRPFTSLNPGTSYGRLRILERGERPAKRDIVVMSHLPNQISRVAGVITSVQQTPLSHVNLRAVQNQIPNAFIKNATQNELVTSLAGKYVRFEVTSDHFNLREATETEVLTQTPMRPSRPQMPTRDLLVTKIRTLGELGFGDFAAFGVKAANLAEMKKLETPEVGSPDGLVVPFFFYDEFMKHNGLYDAAEQIIGSKNPESDLPEALKEFRKQIKLGDVPEWMLTSLDSIQESFPAGTRLRCRSSTNNEDLPGFSGAGLYDSFTHKQTEGHIAKTIKQVYASIWNFRAFEERDFYRVDHMTSAMAVLIHPSYKDELVNGVAVTDDVHYGTNGNYYINAQIGDDLVTNPNHASTPEEILLSWFAEDGHQIMASSSETEVGQAVLSREALTRIRAQLERIHRRFAKLYDRDQDDARFAMEVEFKVDADGKLVVKQARPWVYAGPP